MIRSYSAASASRSDRVQHRLGPGAAVAARVPDAAQVDRVDDRQLVGVEQLGEVPPVGVVLLMSRRRVPGRLLEFGHDGGQLIVFLIDRGIAVQLSDQRRHVMRGLEYLRSSRPVRRARRGRTSARRSPLPSRHR